MTFAPPRPHGMVQTAFFSFQKSLHHMQQKNQIQVQKAHSAQDRTQTQIQRQIDGKAIYSGLWYLPSNGLGTCKPVTKSITIGCHYFTYCWWGGGRKQIPGLIMLFDFEKSYDMSWNFFFKTLEYFIFGKSIKKVEQLQQIFYLLHKINRQYSLLMHIVSFYERCLPMY